MNKKSINIVLVPSQRYQDSRHLLQNPKNPRTVIGFNNCAQKFTGSNYLDVDIPFAPHLDGSTADFAPHMEGSHADIEGRHSFRDQKIAKIVISANFHKSYHHTTYILGVDMKYINTFKNKNILRKSTFNKVYIVHTMFSI